MPRLVSAAAAVAALIAAAAVGSASGSKPLRTGVLSVGLAGAAAQSAFSSMATLGASSVVLDLVWSTVVSSAAPSAHDFDPADPASPYYDWSFYDQEFEDAAAHGLTVLGIILNAPS